MACGGIGISIALLLYTILLNFTSCPDHKSNIKSKVSNDGQNAFIPSCTKETNAMWQPTLGYGKLVLQQTFLFPCWANDNKRKQNKTSFNRTRAEMLVIAICLLLSGDIHQCPGPTLAPALDACNESSTEVLSSYPSHNHPSSHPYLHLTQNLGHLNNHVYSIPVIGSALASTRRNQNTVSAYSRKASNIARSRGTKQHNLEGLQTPLQTRRRVDFKVLRPLQKFIPPTPPPTPQKMKMALLNAQSIGNKASLLHRHIIDNDLHVLCLTECWHEPGVFMGLNELCPPGFNYLETARTGKGGGGLAVFYRQELELKLIPIAPQSTFESLAFKCKSPALTVLLIYRPPPKANKAFFSEFQDLLTSLCSTTDNILALGDFNIHVDIPSDSAAIALGKLLDYLHLTQHVSGPTHKKGHTLDLVISNTNPIDTLKVHSIGVSDHAMISMELLFPTPLSKPKRKIQFRNLKRINQAALSLDLQNISSHATSLQSATELVEYYNDSLSNLLNQHAPLKTRSVSFERSAPWYTNELRKMKTFGRVLERRFVASGLTVHKEAYREHQKEYAKSLSTSRSQFFSNIINNNPSNSKRLFTTINHLLKPKSHPHSEATEEKCDEFMTFYKGKVNNIRSHLSSFLPPQARVEDPSHRRARPLSSFEEISQQKAEKIINKMKPTTCDLDPFPTALLKSNLSVISSLITQAANVILQSGHFPTPLKTAVIRPLPKKPSLDPEIPINTRPVSNLPWLSKFIENIVADQLRAHLIKNDLFDQFQSGFRSGHSTETALVRVLNDLLITADDGSPSLLILLDITAAFDTIDHNILLQVLHSTIGLDGTALKWFTSYLSDRTEYVALGKARSQIHSVTCGVPQGSVLGPTLFTLYMLPLGHIIRKHGISFHCYADDTQLYLRLKPTPSTPQPLVTLDSCLEEIEAWMKLNYLQLNSSKTQAIQIGTPHQIKSLPITNITFSGQTIPLSTSVTNLGVIMDSQLTFETHIKSLCQKSFFHLRNISKIRKMLSQSAAEKLVHAFVSSRLDYCNALLIGISGCCLQKLQYIQNSAARILMRVRKFDHITPILKTLHWLPISSRVEYKISLLTHQCLYGNAPSYLKELLTPKTCVRTLRSSFRNQLTEPKWELATMGRRAFSTIAPKLWNALPDHLRAPQLVEAFKRQLKTHLFTKAFP